MAEDELKRLLTSVRQVQNEANKLTIERLRYEGNYEIDFDTALESARRADDTLIAFVQGPLQRAFAELGRYLIEYEAGFRAEATDLLEGPPVSELDFAAAAQRWYERRYAPLKVG